MEQVKFGQTNISRLTKVLHIETTTNPAQLKMPPELTITTSQSQRQDEVVGNITMKNSNSVNTKMISELPPLNGFKKTHLWHNIKRCVPTIK